MDLIGSLPIKSLIGVFEYIVIVDCNDTGWPTAEDYLNFVLAKLFQQQQQNRICFVTFYYNTHIKMNINLVLMN